MGEDTWWWDVIWGEMDIWGKVGGGGRLHVGEKDDTGKKGVFMTALTPKVILSWIISPNMTKIWICRSCCLKQGWKDSLNPSFYGWWDPSGMQSCPSQGVFKHNCSLDHHWQWTSTLWYQSRLVFNDVNKRKIAPNFQLSGKNRKIFQSTSDSLDIHKSMPSKMLNLHLWTYYSYLTIVDILIQETSRKVTSIHFFSLLFMSVICNSFCFFSAKIT